MDNYLKEKWCYGLGVDSLDDTAIFELNKIIEKYSESHRHYHNLNHILELLKKCDEYKINSPNIVLAIFYHDVIYSTLLPGNEDKSAQFADDSLRSLGEPPKRIKMVREMVLATKKHQQKINDPEIQLFLDLDFCIMGYSEADYEKYVVAIRNEYSSIPKFLFNSGRKKFLQSVANEAQLFHTTLFESEFGNQARINIQKELKDINGEN